MPSHLNWIESVHVRWTHFHARIDSLKWHHSRENKEAVVVGLRVIRIHRAGAKCLNDRPFVRDFCPRLLRNIDFENFKVELTCDHRRASEKVNDELAIFIDRHHSRVLSCYWLSRAIQNEFWPKAFPLALWRHKFSELVATEDIWEFLIELVVELLHIDSVFVLVIVWKADEILDADVVMKDISWCLIYRAFFSFIPTQVASDLWDCTGNLFPDEGSSIICFVSLWLSDLTRRTVWFLEVKSLFFDLNFLVHNVQLHNRCKVKMLLDWWEQCLILLAIFPVCSEVINRFR